MLVHLHTGSVVKTLDTKFKERVHPREDDGRFKPKHSDKRGRITAAGIVYLDPEGYVLLCKRHTNAEHYPNVWALPAGGVEKGEAPRAAAVREFKEETEHEPPSVESIGTYEEAKVRFYAYKATGPRFEPKLDREHTAFVWAPLHNLPHPLHPGAHHFLSNLRPPTADKRWRGRSLDEEFKESEHPRAPDGEFTRGVGGHAASTIAAAKKQKAEPAWTKHDGTAFAPHETERLKALRIPPAWQRIKLSDDPTAPLQATGYDVKGRRQYVYSAAHSEKAAAEKFARLKAFNAVASKIVASATSDMMNPKLKPAQRDAAAVVKLISATGFRIGSEDNTGADVQAHGASTLTREHVKVKRDGTLSFDFIGKKGVQITKTIKDPELARYVKAKLDSGAEKIFDARQDLIRGYLKAQGGAEFKVKDFRTWNGTNMALKTITSLPEPTNAKEYKKFRLEVGKATAAHLGNTPTVALAAYIDPSVFARWSHLQ